MINILTASPRIASYASYLGKCFTQIYRALYEDAMFVPLGGNSDVPYCKTNNPVELKCCKTPSSYRVYNPVKLKPQKERQF